MAKQVSPGVLALRKVVDDVYADAREAKKQGKLVGWSSSKFPCELAEAFDLNVMYPENQAAGIAAQRDGEIMCQAAEDLGFDNDICGYARISLAYAAGKRASRKFDPETLEFIIDPKSGKPLKDENGNVVIDPATGKQAIELIDEIQHKTDTTVLIIEHRLEDVLWRNVDRIILVNEGTILADLRPDELLATHMLAENGIREPLYLTAMRYAGIAITPEKRPAHVDTVVLDDADTARLHKWFHALPLPEPDPAPEHLLEVRGLGFGYTKGQSTLHDISFSIGKGEMVSIVGRNGAGKSTLAKLICGFETPEQGQVLLNGRDLAQDNIRRRAQHIGYVMQNPNQMISKTMIFEEVALALQGSDMTQEQIRQRVEDTLKVCGLYPFRNWPISALSFGQKKRVTIASVLVQQPELIILDEPTAGQDFRHYTDIMEFLRGLNEQGVTVVMITHDMHLMLEYTPRALVFCDGQLIADRSAAAVLCDPELIEQAALKETSLFTLANRCGIAPAEDFVERFIHEDREVRTHGC